VITIKVLSLDPSGNYNEGSGTTGWAVFEDETLTEFGTISATDFSTVEGYWSEHENLIVMKQPKIVVCEDYRLFAHKAKVQTNSQMETPQLIGYLRMTCWKRAIKIVFQQPAKKVRFPENVLIKMGFIEKRKNCYYCMGKPTNIHIRDAIRHGAYFNRYYKER
jgi:competence protein ComGF